MTVILDVSCDPRPVIYLLILTHQLTFHQSYLLPLCQYSRRDSTRRPSTPS
jgi:hypothetical protein